MKALKEMTGPELVAAYNDCAKVLGLNPVNRFSSIQVGIRRVEGVRALMPQQQDKARATQEAIKEDAAKARKFYPYGTNIWHSMNKANPRTQKEIHDAVFQNLLDNREGEVFEDEEGVRWQMVYLDNCGLPGMPDRIWSGHLSMLSQRNRYKPVKGKKGAFGRVVVG